VFFLLFSGDFSGDDRFDDDYFPVYFDFYVFVGSFCKISSIISLFLHAITSEF
jgi:hypothetical protein